MVMELSDVQMALERDELVPCFQPLVELRTGRLAGFEVLARWKHPEHGYVLPENFISLAEKNGLIGQLMQQVFRKAFQSAPVLPEPLVLAVNVSPTQLHHLTLPGQIRELAEEAGFPLKRLTVEITESALLYNLERAQIITKQLKAMGCRLALDDFGTGYSSLGHLQALPFDELKIDRSFVASMTNTRDSRKIVAAIVGLGHSLGCMTIAEGVETEEQADMLLWLGCGFGQGWLYGHPVTADKIPSLVAAPLRAMHPGFSTPGDGWGASSLEALPTQRLAQLQAIYDGAPVGLCFLDSNLRYVSLNKRLAEMNGPSVAAHLGKTPMEMVPHLFPLYEPYLLRALQGEAMEGVEVVRPSPTPGEPDRISLTSYQPAFDEADEVIGISIAVVDITEHKRTEEALRESDEALRESVEALRESDEHYRHMVESNPQALWVMDAEGNNLDVSSRWVRTTGLSKERTRHLGWLEALHPDDLAPTMKAMKEALRTGKPIDIEYRVKSVDGEWKWMRSRGSPRFNPSGEIIRWYGSVEDIDERIQMEEAIGRS